MMVNSEPTARKTARTMGRRKQERIRSLGAAAQFLATTAGLATLYLAWTISGSPVQATMYIMLGLAGIIGISTFATLWAQTALAEQLDILNVALNAAPDAQAILAADGGLTYANLAFDRLFPGRGKPPLDRIECSVATDPESVSEFLRLRTRATAGVRTTVAVSLRDARGGTL